MSLQFFKKSDKFCLSIVINSILTDSVIRKMGKWQEDHAARCTLCLFLESLMKLPVPWVK